MASEVKTDKLSQRGSSGIVISDDIKLSSGKAIKNAAGTALLGEDGALGGVTFPAGHVLKTEYSLTMDSAWDQGGSYIGDGIPTERMLHSDQITITSGNHVLVSVMANVAIGGKGNNENYVKWFLSGGSIATTSGKNLFLDYLYPSNWRFAFSGQFLDTAPGSTTPTYGLYIGEWTTAGGDHRYTNEGTFVTLQEIKS